MPSQFQSDLGNALGVLMCVGETEPLRLVLAAELELAKVRALLVERTNGHADALRRLGVRLLAAADAMEQK